MVEPLRKWLFPIDAPSSIGGLFVFNRSNAQSLPIPHLPLLRAGAADECLRAEVIGDGDGLEHVEIGPRFETVPADGDIVWVDGTHGLIKSVLSAHANANTLLVTEKCDNRCSFCSQPPNAKPDDALYRDAALSILNFNSEGYVGISGGEPTLNQRAFMQLLMSLAHFGNRTKLHVLSNGRRFSNPEFAKEVREAIGKRTVLWGIPLYGHRSALHDALVGAQGAFIETLEGLLNMCGAGMTVELRVVPTQQNIEYLPDIVRLVVSAYPSIRLISIMNLEPKGWARTNYERLYVRVRDQGAPLGASVELADRAGREVRLFNYPLCLLPAGLRPFAVKSISDWKNYYPDECDACRLLHACGGFFASATGRFREQVEVQ